MISIYKPTVGLFWVRRHIIGRANKPMAETNEGAFSMSMTMPGIPSGNPNFKRLLDCARSLIEEKGCVKTTLQDIMACSGLSKGAIYHYVKSKEELFGLLLQFELGKVDDRFRQAAASSGDLTGPLRAIAAGLTAMQQEDSVGSRVLTYLLSQRGKSGIQAILSEYHERTVAMSTGWIELGQQEGVIHSELNASMAAEQFVTVAYGMGMRNLLANVSEAGGAVFGEEEFYRYMLAILKK
ncbi:TetR/AcrR family transcriptional regulator [Paenibacillus sp. LHD-117]|uniref:TetR/AcrR family transcriptional regulator n=1 Tax=Paenibacillus sp. LHD-117 TaxID=3071412 RepID=UPI0027DF37F5|nr:TetR/AcrR family transcriptional regulator [Paenibacillus sp. LHD-117]MDQ6419865.1 TetR/AcrR family transcriptional regulator [Paenibacillus sp. LHD-117]